MNKTNLFEELKLYKNYYNLFSKDIETIDDFKNFSQFCINYPNIGAFNVITENILKEDYLLLNNIGTELIDFIAISNLFSQDFYFSERKQKYFDTFTISPFAEKSALFADYGYFHTDFSTLDNKPKYVALQCVEPDPKYPSFSKNSIVNVTSIFNRIENLAVGFTEYCLNLSFPCFYRFGEETENIKYVKLLTKDNNNQLKISINLGDIAEEYLTDIHLFNGKPIHRIINAVANELASEVILNQGDMIIFSNEYVLHKRGEATVQFIDSLHNWHSRTIRYISWY